MAPLPAPAGLGDAGRALWDSIADPEHAWRLNPSERAILARACHVADRLAVLDAEWSALEGPPVARGYMGQEVEHPVIKSLATADALLVRLLTSLKLPDLDERTGSGSTSAQARRAAQARWAKPRSS